MKHISKNLQLLSKPNHFNGFNISCMKHISKNLQLLSKPNHFNGFNRRPREGFDGSSYLVVFTGPFWAILIVSGVALSGILYWILRLDFRETGSKHLLLSATSFVALSLLCREISGISTRSVPTLLGMRPIVSKNPKI
jgi:hypothetical protein